MWLLLAYDAGAVYFLYVFLCADYWFLIIGNIVLVIKNLELMQTNNLPACKCIMSLSRYSDRMYSIFMYFLLSFLTVLCVFKNNFLNLMNSVHLFASSVGDTGG